MKCLTCCINESLRYGSTATISLPMTVVETTNLGKYRLLKGTDLFFDIYALSRLPEQWQKPNEFILERFDPESPLSLTPSGKKRHAMSFVSFGVGNRTCAGKTFA